MARSKKAQAALDSVMAAKVAQGQVGLGVDLIEIDRMRSILDRTPSFAAKVFSDDERGYCDCKGDSAASYAARFAAKEAVVKALGYGFSSGIGARDIEVALNKKGRPEIVLHGRAREIADEMGITDMPVSLSHTKSDAIACVIAITKSSTEATIKRMDPTEELAKRFREARGMLDDLPSASAPVPSDAGSSA